MSKKPATIIPAAKMPENSIKPTTPPYFPGDSVPWFQIASDVNPDFAFSSLAGRYVILNFMGSLNNPAMATVTEKFLQQKQAIGNREGVCLFVTCDTRDANSVLTQNVPHMRVFYDFNGAVSKLYGIVKDDNLAFYTPTTYILDTRLRVLARINMTNPDTHVKQVMSIFEQFEKPMKSFIAMPQAPVLMIPHVFEPDFCRMLIEGYEKNGGEESGFMKEQDGKTVIGYDPKHKRRADWLITDESLIKEMRARFIRRVLPEVQKAYQYEIEVMERYLIACYDSVVEGHFEAHRDNTTKGTAHRRFAISVNLNSEDYEGGELSFPEFGPARYKPPTGGACVFSCSLMHKASAVTRGKRYVFLPFLYDNEAAKIRDENMKFVDVPDKKRA